MRKPTKNLNSGDTRAKFSSQTMKKSAQLLHGSMFDLTRDEKLDFHEIPQLKSRGNQDVNKKLDRA